MARRKRFSAEFKRQVLRRAAEPGMTDALVCEELGVSTRQLRRWKDAVREHGEEEAFPGHGKARDNEVAKLRRELKKVTEERDFLREAARYFAKESKRDTLVSIVAASNIPSGSGARIMLMRKASVLQGTLVLLLLVGGPWRSPIIPSRVSTRPGSWRSRAS